MGFVATEQVEALTYDFRPHADVQGTIPEPSSKQVEEFRNRIFASVQDLGLNPEDLLSGKIGFDRLDEVMSAAGAVEAEMVLAVADLTGIAHSTLNSLPYRVLAAFSGWIVGEFLNPEA